MFIRRYMPEDCRDMSELFYGTVHSVNAKDYTAVDIQTDFMCIRITKGGESLLRSVMNWRNP